MSTTLNDDGTREGAPAKQEPQTLCLTCGAAKTKLVDGERVCQYCTDKQAPLPVFLHFGDWHNWMDTLPDYDGATQDQLEAEFAARENWRKLSALGLTVEQFIEAATTGKHFFNNDDGDGFCGACRKGPASDDHFLNDDGTPMAKG